MGGSRSPTGSRPASGGHGHFPEYFAEEGGAAADLLKMPRWSGLGLGPCPSTALPGALYWSFRTKGSGCAQGHGTPHSPHLPSSLPDGVSAGAAHTQVGGGSCRTTVRASGPGAGLVRG